MCSIHALRKLQCHIVNQALLESDLICDCLFYSVQLAYVEEESTPPSVASALSYLDPKPKSSGGCSNGAGLFNGVKVCSYYLYILRAYVLIVKFKFFERYFQ